MKINKENILAILKSIALRFNNAGTITAFAAGILLILNSCGVTNINNTQVMNIVNGICTVLISLGILNDTASNGMYIPGIKDTLAQIEAERKAKEAEKEIIQDEVIMDNNEEIIIEDNSEEIIIDQHDGEGK